MRRNAERRKKYLGGDDGRKVRGGIRKRKSKKRKKGKGEERAGRKSNKSGD